MCLRPVEILQEGGGRAKQEVIIQGDQLALQQRADGAVAAGAAHALDAGLADRLGSATMVKTCIAAPDSATGRGAFR
jgi:hypothetical protein